MAESTLSYGLSDFRKEICYFMGFGLTYADASSDQQDRINRAMANGEHLFYRAVDGHKWSFLYPIATLTTTSGDDDYTMDDDFLGVLGPMTFQTSDNRAHVVKKTSADKIRELWQTDAHGPPQLFAVEPIEGSQTTGNRKQIILWPAIDATWVLRYRMSVAPHLMTSTRTYMFGTAEFAECQMQCMLAAAEKLMLGKWGPNYHGPGGALELLKDAVLKDQKEEPEFYGYMTDPGTYALPMPRYTWGSTHTYNGTDVTEI